MKRLKNIEGKNEEQLKAFKDQREKKLQILINKTDKKVEFKNISLKYKLNSELKKNCNKIKEQKKPIDCTTLFLIGSFKHHYYNFTIFLSLGSFSESIYISSISLKAAKIKQRNMEEMTRELYYCD